MCVRTVGRRHVPNSRRCDTKGTPGEASSLSSEPRAIRATG
jgi:hypothetical protein